MLADLLSVQLLEQYLQHLKYKQLQVQQIHNITYHLLTATMQVQQLKQFTRVQQLVLTQQSV